MRKNRGGQTEEGASDIKSGEGGKNKDLERQDTNNTQDRDTRGGTQTMPFSFFEEDQQKWKNKFIKAIKEREVVKKNIAKTQEITFLTRNTNVHQGAVDV